MLFDDWWFCHYMSMCTQHQKRKKEKKLYKCTAPYKAFIIIIIATFAFDVWCDHLYYAHGYVVCQYLFKKAREKFHSQKLLPVAEIAYY